MQSAGSFNPFRGVFNFFKRLLGQPVEEDIASRQEFEEKLDGGEGLISPPPIATQRPNADTFIIPGDENGLLSFTGNPTTFENLIAAGGQNLIAAGGQNLIAAGGQNLIAAGGQNLIAAGGQNLIAAGGQNLIAAGGQNLIAAGGQNLIAAGGQNLIAAGGLNLEEEELLRLKGQLIAVDGGSLISSEALRAAMAKEVKG